MALTHSLKWPGELRKLHLLLAGAAQKDEAVLAVIAGRVELALVADHAGNRCRRALRPSQQAHRRGRLPPSYQKNFSGRPIAAGGKLAGDDRPLGVTVPDCARRLWPRTEVGFAQIQAHVGHVHGVAGHVAQGAACRNPTSRARRTDDSPWP